MQPIRHIGQGRDAFPRFQRDRFDPFDINRGDLLALPEVPNGRFPSEVRIDPESDAGAQSALIETQHQTRLMRGASVMMRVHAQTSAPPS